MIEAGRGDNKCYESEHVESDRIFLATQASLENLRDRPSCKLILSPVPIAFFGINASPTKMTDSD